MQSQQKTDIWNLPLTIVDQQASGSGIKALYEQVALTLIALVVTPSVYTDIKLKLQKVLGETHYFHKFSEIQQAIAERGETIPFGEVIAVIDELEHWLSAMWTTARLAKIQEKDRDPFIELPDMQKLVKDVQKFKINLYYLLKNDLKDAMGVENIEVKKALSRMVARDAEIMKSKIRSINKDATEKFTDKIAAQRSHIKEGTHTTFKNLADLLENHFSIEEDKFKQFIHEYQKLAFEIAYGSANDNFLTVLQNVNAELKSFMETHQFFYPEGYRLLSSINRVNAAVEERKQNADNVHSKDVIGIVNDLLHGQAKHKKEALKKEGAAYAAKGIKRMVDDEQVTHFATTVAQVLERMRTLAPLEDAVELKEKEKKGNAIALGAKKGIEVASDKGLGWIPFVGKALAGVTAWAGGKGVDLASEKLAEKMERTELSDEKQAQFKELIVNPELDLRLLSTFFVGNLLAVYPDAFTRMQLKSQESLTAIMEKLTLMMAMMMPHFTDKLVTAFTKDNSSRERYQEMGLILVDAFSAGCEDRLFLHDLIKQWKVPFVVDVKNNIVEEVQLFDIFTKCGLVATPSYQQKKNAALHDKAIEARAAELEKAGDKKGADKERDRKVAWGDGELIMYAPENRDDPSAINVTKYGVRHVDASHEQFGIGFTASCLREKKNNGRYCVSNPDITYQSVIQSLANTPNPYLYSVVSMPTKDSVSTNVATRDKSATRGRSKASTFTAPPLSIVGNSSNSSMTSTTATTSTISNIADVMPTMTTTNTTVDIGAPTLVAPTNEQIIAQQALQIQLLQQQLQQQAQYQAQQAQQMQQMQQMLQQVMLQLPQLSTQSPQQTVSPQQPPQQTLAQPKPQGFVRAQPHQASASTTPSFLHRNVGTTATSTTTPKPPEQENDTGNDPTNTRKNT